MVVSNGSYRWINSWNMIEGKLYCSCISIGKAAISGTISIHQISVTSIRMLELRNVRRTQKYVDESNQRKETRTRYRGWDLSFWPTNCGDWDKLYQVSSFDDKVSAAILLNPKVYARRRAELPVTTHFCLSVFEEAKYGANSKYP